MALYNLKLLKQISENTSKRKGWIRADRIIGYISSVGTIILSIMVLLQHGEIDELRKISKADTTLINSNQNILKGIFAQNIKHDSELLQLNSETNFLDQNTVISGKELNELAYQNRSKKVQDAVHLYFSADALRNLPNLGYTSLTYGGIPLKMQLINIIDSILLSEMSNSYLLDYKELSILWQDALKKTASFKQQIDNSPTTPLEMMQSIDKCQNYSMIMANLYVKVKLKISEDKIYKTLF